MRPPRFLLSATLLAALFGCDTTQRFDQLDESIDVLSKSVAENNAKLTSLKDDPSAEAELIEMQSAKIDSLAEQVDQLSKKVDKLNARAPSPARPRPGRPDPKEVYKVDLNGAHAKGPATAKVTIVEWSDFQCPFCKRVVPTLKQIDEEYGSEVRVVFKHNPLPMHNRAMPAALAAEAAGKQGKFWEMHDILFEHGRELTDENFEQWAEDLQLNVGRFKRDMADPALKERIVAMQEQGATLGARGTPAFFVNGRFLSGAQPFPAFKSLIDEEMKKADKLLASGTPRRRLYEKTIEDGKTKVD